MLHNLEYWKMQNVHIRSHFILCVSMESGHSVVEGSHNSYTGHLRNTNIY